MAPVVEDMLQDTRIGLTEAVVIGPGKAILFYGRRSMGEGLKADEARDATFLITGSGTWVGKLAYLTADPMMLLEGRRAITHAPYWIKEQKLGGQDALESICQPNSLLGLMFLGLLPLRACRPKETQTG